jgi:two-component system, cell cycle sensor histidine kinase and response regulator CckA
MTSRGDHRDTPLDDLFVGDGEMARLCRHHDWASTPLGPAEEWPLSLKTTVRTILASRHPMILWWGPELIQIYNDAYRPSLGTEGRHPSALGAPGRECWEEIWDVIGPDINQVLSGGDATWHEDLLVPITRNRGIEDVYWSYGYSPVTGDDGTIQGVLVVCQETTARVMAEGRLLEREQLLGIAGRMARIGGWSVDLRSGLVDWSAEVCDIHEVPHGTTPTVDQAIEYYAPEWRSLIRESFTRCAREGAAFDLDLQVITESGRRIWVRAIGEAVRSADGTIQRVQGAFQDVQRHKEVEEELRESDRRFRELAESMPLIVWSADPVGKVDYQTQAMHEFSGLGPDELAGDAWFEAVHPDDRSATARAWTHSLETGDPYECEFRIRRHDGEWRWHLSRARPFRAEDGTILKWYGSSTDIHDQLELMNDAEALAKRLTTTLESITDAFYLLDPEWRLAFLNEEAERVLERRRDELLGRKLWEAFPATVGTVLEEEYRRATRDGSTASFRYFYPPLERWFDIRAYPSSEGLAVYFRDITEERAVELRLRDQAELLDRAQDAILVRQLDHRLEYWNAGAERIYGWSRQEALGKSVRDLLYRDPAAFDRATAAVLESGEWSGELEHLRKDGTIITAEGRWSLVRDDDGVPRKILSINTDITERKKLLGQFLRAQRMESIGTLAGGVAHDLNNVLAPILLSIAMLKEDTDDPATLEILDTIEASARHGSEMVQQVLGFARGLDRSDVRVELAGIIRDLGRFVRDTFPKDISLVQEIPDDLWALTGDATQLHQVFMNLFVNARDAMPSGGTIAIHAENVELDDHYAAMSSQASAGPHVMVSVSDTGAGMAAEVVDQIFDPFFTTKEVGQGTGLGLATVAAIVRSHGGFVNVYSEPGSGTTFRLYIPARDVATDEAEPEDSHAPPRGKGELVLVVDDEQSIREIARRTLEAFGYRVITATDGADAIAVYARRGNEIDVVLTDVVMPIMDGPATIRALRRMDSDVRIIAASGLGAHGGVARSVDEGVTHFLAKPYTAEDLLETLHRVLQAKDSE